MLTLPQKKKHIEDFFSDVEFIEDTHTYFFKGKKLTHSVSKIVSSLAKKVDFSIEARNKDKYSGLPEGTHERMWANKTEVALALGNESHYFGEIYCEYPSIIPTNLYQKAIVRFWETLPEHIVLVKPEIKMAHHKYLFGGMSDILLYNTKTGKFIIADYKTNEDILNSFPTRLKYPFQVYNSSDLSKYKVQLNTYQILFEQCGLEVEKRVVIWLTNRLDANNKPEFRLFWVEDLRKEVNEYLEIYHNNL